MKRALVTLGLSAGLCLWGCHKPYDNGYAVDLIVSGDGTVDLTRIKTLEFDVSGAETAQARYALDRPFDAGEERVIYRPQVAGGELAFDVRGMAADATLLGRAIAQVTLAPGKTVTQRIQLSSMVNADGGPTGLLLDRASFDFGTFVSGQSATAHVFVVTNATSAQTGPLAVTLGGAGAAQYSLAADTCSGRMLDAKATCTISVGLKTSDVGVPTATLDVSAAPAGMASLALSGTIVAPGDVSIVPAAADFGSAAQGRSSSALSFEVRNNGLAATGALAVTIAGDDGPLFGTPSGCNGMTLASGASCMVMVTFQPPGSATLGMKTATLRVEGMPGGIGAAELRGSVIQPGTIGITPGFYDLGKINIGQTSATSSYVVTNTGNTPTGPLSTTPSGNPGQFEIVSDGCQGQALPAAGTCQIDVRYKPTQAGSATLVLTVSGTPGGTAPATAVGIGGDFVTLTVNRTGATGAISASGISCGADCTEKYDRNSMVTLSALPDLTSRFNGWGGGVCPSAKAGSCTLTMDADKTVGADFAARPASNFAFVTSTTIIPKDLGAAGADPLVAADAVCKARAFQGGLPGTYKAFLGVTGTNPISRLGTASGWVRTDGLPAFKSQAELAMDKPLYPIRLDESGTQLADDPNDSTGSGDVATGSDHFGAFLAPNCSDWSAGGTYVYGYVGGASDGWIAINDQRDCAQPAHLYCFETTYTAGVTVTPPATFRRAFLTQGTYQAPVTGIAAADTICNNEKTTYGVTVGGGGNFRAMLAPTGAVAASRFNIAGGTAPWVRPDGVVLAPTAAALFTDSLQAGINVTANGTYLGGFGTDTPFLFIGSAGGVTQNGQNAENCSNWGSESGAVNLGRTYFFDKNWTTGLITGCSHAMAGTNLARFLCLEQ